MLKRSFEVGKNITFIGLVLIPVEITRVVGFAVGISLIPLLACEYIAYGNTDTCETISILIEHGGKETVLNIANEWNINKLGPIY